MNCRDLLFILIVVIFCTTINAAPPVSKTAPQKWQHLANNPKFYEYRATLLDPEIMPFLADCYSKKCCTKNDEYSCSLYFDAVSWARDLHVYPNMTRANAEAVINKPQPVDEVCQAVTAKGNETASEFRLSDERFRSKVQCIIACGDMSTLLAKPPCAASLWLLNVVSSIAEAMKKADATKKDMPESLPKSDNAAVESDGASLPLSLVEPPQKNKSKVPLQLPKSPVDSIIPKQHDPSGKAAPTPQQAEPAKNAPKVGAEETGNPVGPQKPIPKSVATPSVAESDKEVEVDEMEPPVVGSKTTTESVAAPAPLDIEEDEEKQFADPSDDDVSSNENMPNLANQMDQFNEPKMKMQHMPQIQKVDPNIIIEDRFRDEPSSNFFFYFLFGMFLVIVGYVAYNNKSKIVALILEGRRSRGTGRRKHTAAYRKLDSNLEEAIMSAPSGRTTQVIY